MIQLLYTSVASRDIGPDELKRIGALAADRNGVDGISGLLCFDGQKFMQLIEGPRDSIQSLMKRLQRDERHRDIAVIYEAETAKRDFGHWSMRAELVSSDAQDMAALLPEALDPALRDLMLGFASRG